MIRVLVADDHAVVREGIKAVLRGHADIAIVGEAANGDEALRLVLEQRPDVLLLDLTMPFANGLDIIERVRASAPTTHVLVLSMHSSPEYVRPAVRAGAQGFVVKGAGIEELVQAIHVVVAGGEFLDPKARASLEAKPSDELAQLTIREREVVTLVAGGATNRDVADQLGISPKTVDAHRTNVMRKLNLHSVQELTRFAIRWGLLADGRSR